jgi:hypothetical protein
VLMLARRSAVCAGECPRGVPHEVLPQRHGCLAMPIAAAQASSRHDPAHGKHNQVDHMGPMGSKFRCPTEIPDASVVRHDVADARGNRPGGVSAPRSSGVAGDFARRVRREHHNGGLAAGVGQEQSQESCQGEARGSRLKESGRGLISPYPAPEPFIAQALTVLGISTVEFPYTGDQRPRISSSQIERDYRALSDATGNIDDRWCPMVLAHF